MQLKSPHRPRVLVTGSRGLLGATLMPCLRAHASEFEVLEAPSRTRAPQSADLSLALHVNRMLDDARPDVVLNLAALANVDYCEAHPSEAYATNAELVRHLATWIASTSPACRLVHISSDQMYDGPGLHDERTVRPCNYYAYSKVLSEQYAARVNATTLRTNFFGCSHSDGRASLSDWIVSSIRDEQDITVYTDVLFSPLSMLTLSESIAHVVARPLPGVFNVGARDGMTKADFAFALADAVGLPTSGLHRGLVDDAPRTARRPSDMRMSSACFHATFGGEPPRLIDEIHRAAKEYV